MTAGTLFTAGPRVAGLDLSLTATGLAQVNGETLTINPKQKGDHRLPEIRARVLDAVVGQADLVVIEDLLHATQSAGLTGMVHGVVRAALIDQRIPYVTVAPASLKKYATGRGNCDKTAMAVAAMSRAGLEFRDNNQCDAWWLRLMGLDGMGRAELALPMTQRASLSKVQWPVLVGESA